MSTSNHEQENRAIGTIVFDLDGVVYLGSSPIEGAASTISELAERGWQLLYATNNSTKTPESIAEVLRDRVGVKVDPWSITTSGMAAAAYLAERGLESAYVLGSPQLEDTLRARGIAVTDGERPDAVVIGFDRHPTHDKINKASRAVSEGAAFIATNTDATLPTPQGEVPGTGTIVAAVVEASGREYVACGKPERPMYELINRKIGQKVAKGRVIMVGDRPETDIALAQSAGWESVLTLTGVTSHTRDVPQRLTPDRVVASIADLSGIVAVGPQ